MFNRSICLCILLTFSFFLFFHLAQAAEPVTELISSDSNGVPGGGASGSTSGDGRYVAFVSANARLVPGDWDWNNKSDVFVRDRLTGTTTRVSVNTDGSHGNNDSGSPAISSNGRYVAFYSAASNMVQGDTNNRSDIFFHDRQTGETTIISVDSAGNQGNSSSYQPSMPAADGRFIAFQSIADNLVAGDTNGLADIFLHDRQTGETKRVSVDSAGNEANGRSWNPSISADGRYIAFRSRASNLVANDTNDTYDIFVHDSQTGETTRVSISSTGEEGNAESDSSSISGNGRFVVFSSLADNLVNNDTNGIIDIFRHDRETGITERVSLDSQGNQVEGPNLPHSGSRPFISRLGRYIAFESFAANLVENDPNGGGKDMFIKNMVTGGVTRVDFGYHTTLKVLENFSADGNFLVFRSDSDTLVSGDTNAIGDVFVHGPLLDPKIRNTIFIPAIPQLLLP